MSSGITWISLVLSFFYRYEFNIDFFRRVSSTNLTLLAHFCSALTFHLFFYFTSFEFDNQIYRIRGSIIGLQDQVIVSSRSRRSMFKRSLIPLFATKQSAFARCSSLVIRRYLPREFSLQRSNRYLWMAREGIDYDSFTFVPITLA